MAVLAVYIAAKDNFTHPSLLTRWSTFTFKNGCVVRVAKHLKEDWFIVSH